MSMLNERLKLLRNEKGLQQTEVAKLFELSQSAIAGYEAGVREPKCDILIKFADFYGVSLDYLVGRSDRRESGEGKELTDLLKDVVTFNGYELSATNKRRLLDIATGLFWANKSNFEEKE